MINEPRTLPHDENEFMHRHRVREFFDVPIAGVGITASAVVAGTRRITVQVKDRLRADWRGRWLVRIWISATDGGDPSATDNTVGYVSGYQTQIIQADAEYEWITDADGKFEFDLTVIGTATRYIMGIVIGKGESKSFDW